MQRLPPMQQFQSVVLAIQLWPTSNDDAHAPPATASQTHAHTYQVTQQIVTNVQMQQRAVVSDRVQQRAENLWCVRLLIVAREHQRLQATASLRQTILGDGGYDDLGVGLLQASQLQATQVSARNRLNDRHQVALLELVVDQPQAIEILGAGDCAAHCFSVSFLGAELVVAHVHHHQQLGQALVHADRCQDALECRCGHLARPESQPRQALCHRRELGHRRRDRRVDLVARNVQRLDGLDGLDSERLQKRWKIQRRIGHRQRLELGLGDERIQVCRRLLAMPNLVARHCKMLHCFAVEATRCQRIDDGRRCLVNHHAHHNCFSIVWNTRRAARA
jgi:hypothetical protein